MFKPNSVLEDSINKKDIVSIRSALSFIIKCDPTFKTKDFDDAIKYVESKGITIKEPYKLMNDENNIEEKSKWTEKYFYYKTNMLEENFAVAERIPHIKAVGRSVFAERADKIQHESPSSNNEKKSSTANPTSAPSKNRRSKKRIRFQ